MDLPSALPLAGPRRLRGEASAWVLPLALVGGHAVLLALLGRRPEGAFISNLVQLAAAGVAAVACARVYRRARSGARLPWLLVGAACGLWALGQALYAINELMGRLRTGPTFTHVDLAFLAFYLPLLAALFVPADEDRAGRIDWVRVLDVSQVGIVLCSTYLYLFYYLAGLGASRQELLKIGYLQVWDLLNLTVIGGFAFLALSSRAAPLRALYGRLTVPLVAYAAGDAAFNYLRVQGVTRSGDWVDLAYTVPFALVAASALATASPRARPEAEAPSRLASAVHSLLPAFLPIVVLSISLYLAPRAPGLAVTILVASFLCFCLRLAITQRRQDQAIEQLRTSELRARDLVENANDVVFTLDGEGRFATLNRTGRETLGLERPAGIFLTSVVEPEDRPRLEALLDDTLAGQVSGPVELAIDAGDGRRATLEVQARPTSDGKGVEAIARDITERRELESRLLQSQKIEAVGLLAGGVAHDFNNMLNVIFGYSELLAKDLKADPQKLKRVDQIFHAAERAASLTRQLLAFGRRQVLAPRHLDLREVVQSVDLMLRRLIPENIRVAARIGDAPQVRADPAQLELAVLNLAINARDAMPSGGTLTLQVDGVELDSAEADSLQLAHPGRHARLVVSDNGCGMSPETVARVFEPFFTTKGVGKGTGLGLSTVYGLVRQSGGAIGVSSELGEGTVFTIHLPEAASPDDARRPPEAAVPAPRAGRETILLVEDEEALRVLIAEFLTGRGFLVIPASDASEALEASRTHQGPLHAVVTDVVLPGAPGTQLVRELSRTRPGLRTILMTGYSDSEALRGVVAAPGVRLLKKPVSLERLHVALRELIDASAAGTSDPTHA